MIFAFTYAIEFRPAMKASMFGEAILVVRGAALDSTNRPHPTVPDRGRS